MLSSDELYFEMTKRNIGVYTREEQDRLRRSKVLICGLGGVGGMEAILCARMGIGQITGVDPDTFDLSNINRQMLSSYETVGVPKADVARRTLQAINPLLKVETHSLKVDEDTILDLMKGHDLVLEAVDDMPSRVIIHRTARELGIPSIAMSGSPPNRGFVSSFLPGGVAYEDALNLPGKGRRLTDPELRQQIAEVKHKRARYSVSMGAPADWAEAYVRGETGWLITPVRAILLATFSFHEAVQILTGRRPMAPAPKGILIDLDGPQPVQLAEPPAGGWDYATL